MSLNLITEIFQTFGLLLGLYELLRIGIVTSDVLELHVVKYLLRLISLAPKTTAFFLHILNGDSMNHNLANTLEKPPKLAPPSNPILQLW